MSVTLIQIFFALPSLNSIVGASVIWALSTELSRSTSHSTVWDGMVTLISAAESAPTIMSRGTLRSTSHLAAPKPQRSLLAELSFMVLRDQTLLSGHCRSPLAGF